jgi:imidazolonepropionase-like amidohydrolase
MGSRSALTLATTAALGGLAARGLAQPAPVEGIRPAPVRTHAIVGATVVTSPGHILEDATIVIRDGVIEAVGPDVVGPPQARIWPADDLTVYPGLIDMALLVEVRDLPDASADAGAHWNKRVHPQVAMSSRPGPDRSLREALRKIGFTAAAVYPAKGIFRGSGTVIALADEDEHVLVYRPQADMAIGLNDRAPRGDRSYPNSLMGVMALVRQTLHDTRWYAECQSLWRLDPQGQEPPVHSDALGALADVVTGGQRVQFDVTDELTALRAARLAEESQLEAMLLGSGYEFRHLDSVAATGLAVIVPLSYPDRPKVSSLLEADDVSLREMMTWEQAPTNARRLVEAGVTVALTTHRLDKRSEFPAALSKTITHGLGEDDARLLGLSDIMGTIAAGKAANLVVVEGSLFDRKPKIRDTWVNGRRHEVSSEPAIMFVGAGTLRTESGLEAAVEIDTDKAAVTAHLPDGKKLKAKKVVFQHGRLAFVLDARLFDADGYARLSGVITEGTIAGTGALPDGARFRFTISPSTEAEAPDEQESDGMDSGDEDEEDGEEKDFELPPQELVRPLGAFGLAAPPQVQPVIVTNATIWTCGPQGIIDNGTLYVADGKVVSVRTGAPLTASTAVDALHIDGTGKHVTPGIIDSHSHTGVSGNINETTRNVTAEVRIADVINPDDINWYRQLAGGLVAANQLHGSANPIGGQNSVVKLKWSRGADAFPVQGAIPGIKFALGENVKGRQGRYPATRMGVETIMRDAFVAALEYRQQWDRYEALSPDERRYTKPPRRDLTLDTLLEILDGRRLVHCHAYRQDEMLMLMRLADELGFTVGTFQHVLEGYKVAEAMAAHGAGGGGFSDWWAYKVEAMDAIPYNGALMHDVGVVVAFNSDSGELARRLNTEAAKAVRYGGVEPQAALGFVTLNAARHLHIDGRTGSLEPGKDADFVIWSGSPLSAYARCEQTWIEGARYFDLETDRELRQTAQRERQRLVQKILRQEHGKPKPPSESESEQEPDDPDPPGTPDPDPVDDNRPYSCCWSHKQ